MMWKVTCSVKGCGSAAYEAPTQDAARALAANLYLHAQTPHSNTWYFTIVPEAGA